jgi:hypothetical protein
MSRFQRFQYSEASAVRALPLLTSLTLAACNASPPSAAPSPVSSARAPLSGDTFLYLRCNSTSWNLDAKSRFAPTADANVLELVLEVKEASVVSSGDECTLTETPERDGWGLWHETYHAPLSVPGAAPVVGAPDPKQQNFRIYYPDAGRYRARVDRAARTFSIRNAETREGTAQASAPRTHDGLGVAFPQQLILPQERRIEARDRATGAVLWALRTRSSAPLLAGNGTDLLLVTDGDYPNREVLRVDLATGEIIWSVLAGNGSVRLERNQIYLQRNSRLERIDPEYGGTLWAYETAEPWIYVRLTPSGEVLAVEDGKRYSQLNAEDGSPLWTREGAAPHRAGSRN